MKAAIVYNPHSGRARGDATAVAAQRHLHVLGIEADLLPTEGPQHAAVLAQMLAPRADLIVAVGGDGTIHEVVSGIAAFGDLALAAGQARPTCRLGIVPTGTVNVVARELSIPFDPAEACRVIAAQKSVPLDLGRVNDRRFVLMTGAGIDALTIRALVPGLKRLLGSLAFLVTGLTRSLTRPQPEFLVEIDGASYRATFIVAGNCRYYAAHLTVTPHADPTDGLLDFMLFSGTTKASILGFWTGVLLRTNARAGRVTYLRGQQARIVPIEGGALVWMQADGEIVGQIPATIVIEPRAIEVLVP